MEQRIKTINIRIKSGDNQFIQINKNNRRWSLQKEPADDSTINQSFFNLLKPIEIRQVLHYVNQSSNFTDAFAPVLTRYTKQSKNNQVLMACLIAWGTNMGLGRMGEISDIDYTTLATTSDNFIRLETLKEANARVVNAITKLPIFGHYNINKLIHSSSDGQKFETGIDTINSRYSSKYFGCNKGVVSYSTVVNHVPINARIIGANEHESHYVFDNLYNNSTDVQPDIHSTDTHGANEVNFAILHFFGYQFAPRYKDVYDTVRTSLYGFKHPSQYEESIIKPIRKLNTNLIVSEWDNI